MKKLTVIVLVVVVFSAFVALANAQETEVTTKFRSAYLGSTGGMFYDGNVQQTYIDLFWKNGTWAEVWTSTGFDMRDNFGKELDIIVGKDGKLGKLDYSTDAEYFFVQGKDVANLNGQISKSFADGLISPLVRAEIYFPLQTGGLRKGVMGVVGVKSEFKVIPRAKVSLGAQIRKDSGCFENDSAVVGQGFLRVKFTLGEKFSLTPGIMGMIPISHRHDGRVAATASEIAFSYRF